MPVTEREEEIDLDEIPLRESSETDSLENMSEMGEEFEEGYQLLGEEEAMLPSREKAVSFLTNIKKVPPKYAIGAGAALGAAGLGYLAYQAFSPKKEEKEEASSPEKPEETPTQNPKQNAPNPFKYHSEYVNMPQRYKRLSRRGTTG